MSTVTRHSHVICSCLDRVITHRHINDIRINNIETTSTSMTFDNIVTSTTSNRIQRRESSKAKNRGHIVDGHPHKTPPRVDVSVTSSRYIIGVSSGYIIAWVR